MEVGQLDSNRFLKSSRSSMRATVSSEARRIISNEVSLPSQVELNTTRVLSGSRS